jgi:adenylate cyclase
MRLRTTLVLTTVSLLLATVLLLAGTSYTTARRSAAELTSSILSQATDRVDRVVESQLDVAASESQFMASLFERGQLRSDDLEGFSRYATEVIRSHPSLSYVSFGREATGELSQASRPDDGTIEVRFLRLHGESLDLSDFAPDPGGLRLLRTELHKNENEPRPRPYYVAARNARHPVWAETYPFFGREGALGAPGVTLATPVIEANGALGGVITVDFDLRATSRFLKDLDLFKHGYAFIVEYRSDGVRAVIAHPSPELLAPKRGVEAGGLAAVSVSDIHDGRVVEFANSLPLRMPKGTGGMTPVSFSVDGVAFLGGFHEVRGHEVNWVVCALIPEADVLGEVHKNERISLAIILLGTISAVFVALWVGATIARPLRAVADQTEAIGDFQLDDGRPQKSVVVEVTRLGEAVEQMKRNLRSFKKYVPADVVRELVAKGEEARLGGTRATLTIHFSDIAGFTSIAEETSPEALVSMLGEYLDEMTRPILASGGTVDKFIGDAIMAFWGAPKSDAQHALRACEAALTNRDRLAELNARWEKEGRPRLDARAALHTGEVIVGNIGSRERLEYTVIGDAVNLASRLEGLNKKYETNLIISEATYALVKDTMVARPLDRVAVKGKKRAVTVYELLGRKGEVPPETVAVAERYASALHLYFERRFSDAAAVFRDLAHDNANVAARVLAERCEDFVVDPPGPEWTGAEDLRSK